MLIRIQSRFTIRQPLKSRNYLINRRKHLLNLNNKYSQIDLDKKNNDKINSSDALGADIVQNLNELNNQLQIVLKENEELRRYKSKNSLVRRFIGDVALIIKTAVFMYIFIFITLFIIAISTP
jgi:hypothetical protein